MSNSGSAGVTSRLERVARAVSSEDLAVLASLVLVEGFLFAAYIELSGARVTAIRYHLYPYVWINVAIFAVWKTRPAAGSVRDRRVALVVAAAYFAVLSVAGGIVALGGEPFGLTVGFSAPPGYSPTILADNGLVHLSVIPYKLIGYLALTYLVYATVLDAAGSAVSGLLGLLSCVSCSWPVLASIVSSLAGSSAALTSAVTTYSIDLSTVVFVTAVVLLYWRPGFGD